jgi:lipoprotein-anchoring transpeptidase ErfK/SrfK
MIEDSKMPSASALRSSAGAGTLLRVAVIAAAGSIGTVIPAGAQNYWREMEPGYGFYQQRQVFQPPRPQRARRAAQKKDVVVKDTAVHPQMPLIINVSIARQKVRIYDANGLFAEAPVSTGMPGHPTPMGVFSVIQKDRYHHSNIYSGAPMPFMQRITWGGVALHAGVLPGYPASHGCIRMPESFAIKMWGWTKMGARVIVTPGELSPENFSHPLLPALKVAPQPRVAEQPETNDPVATKADRGAPEVRAIEASLELRATVGHNDEAPIRDQTHTADASGGVRANTASDAASVSNAPAPDATSAKTQAKPANTDAAKADSASKASTDTVGSDTKRADAGDTAKSDADAKSADIAESTKPEDKAAAAAKPAGDVAKPADTVSIKPEEKPAEAKPDTAKADSAKADTAKPADKPAEPVKAANAPSLGSAADAKKDQTRLTEPAKPAAKPEKRREGQVAVFISRKDSKLYVRQNFAPWFEVPVTIAPSDRPLGTHVFTASVDKNDTNTLRWTVVTVPLSARAAMRDSDEPRPSRRRGKSAPPPVEAKPVPMPDSPAEALDRITIPPDVMTRISEALATGGSIVVSDQGIHQGETGEYTDFIIRAY